MLHNSGPYGHSDASVNMTMPINGAHLNSAVNMSNMNIGKLAHSNPQATSQHYGPPDYSNLISPFNINNHLNTFHPYNHRAFPYGNTLPSMMPDARRPHLHNQNGLLPMNLNIHNTGNNYMEMQRYPINHLKDPEVNARDLPINVPHLYHKTFQRYELPETVNNVEPEQYKTCELSNQNYATKQKNLCETVTSINENIDLTERDSIESVEKIIEVPDPDQIFENIDTKEFDKPTWSDHEYMNPFIKDANGYPREHFQVESYTIIGGDDSCNEAKDIIQKNDTVLRNRVFQCPHCPLIFKQPKRLLIHTKWHTFGHYSEQRTKTRERRFNSELDLDEKGYFPCSDCNKKFITRKSLRNHRGKYHSGLPKECKMCNKVMPNYKTLRDHIRSEHTDDKNFKCNFCSKVFKVAHSLQKHQDTHLEKTFECGQCDKKFGSELLLAIHMKGHEKMSKGTTYHCSYCGKGFYHSYNLQVHERTHRNERPFSCTICSSTYGTNSGLQRHLKVSHNTNKPWECNTCHRSFSTESIRDRHEVRLHGNPEDLKFPCNLCPSRYMTAKDLGKHYNKVHSKGKKRKRKSKEYSDESE